MVLETRCGVMLMRCCSLFGIFGHSGHMFLPAARSSAVNDTVFERAEE